MIFVQAVDNQFYVDPKITGPNWYIDFNEDGVFIWIKRYPNTTNNSTLVRCRKLLKEKGIKFKFVQVFDRYQTLFPPDFLTLEFASGLEIQIFNQIPIPDLYTEVVNSPPIEHRLLAWKMQFSRQDLLDVFDESKHLNRMLSKFLTGSSTYTVKRSEIQKKLLACLPGLKKFKKHPARWFTDKPDQLELIL